MSNRRGFTITCALQAWATVCAIILYISYKRDNQQRDAFYGKPDPDATVDTSKLADKVCDSSPYMHLTYRVISGPDVPVYPINSGPQFKIVTTLHLYLTCCIPL